MEPTLSSETSAFILRTLGKFPKEHRLHSEHGESLKTTIHHLYGEEKTRSIRLWETLRIKKTKLLVSFTFLLRCRDHNIIPQFLKFRHHFHTRAADRIYKRTSFALLRDRIHSNRRELNHIFGQLLQLHLRLTGILSSSHWDLIDRLSFNKAKQIGEHTKNRQLRKFTSLHTSQHSDNKTIKVTVINLSNQELDEGVYSLLKKGLNYAITPRSPPLKTYVVGSISFRPDIQRPRQMQNALRDI